MVFASSIVSSMDSPIFLAAPPSPEPMTSDVDLPSATASAADAIPWKMTEAGEFKKSISVF